MKSWAVLALALVAVGTSACGIEQVDEGYRGIKKVWGKVNPEPLTPGLYFYNPVSSDIFEMDVREQKMELQTTAFTKDTQSVAMNVTVTYYPDPVKIAALYSQFGHDWDAKIVQQAVLGAIKDVVGQYIADDLVNKREAAKSAAEVALKELLSQRSVTVTALSFTNLDFDDAYEKAVEAKVVAVQRAAEAKNKTVQVEEEAKQRVRAAEADATAMRIKSNALAQNKGLVEYEAIQKWDGKLPEIMFGSATPIINLDKLRK
jgi:prohibitin 2